MISAFSREHMTQTCEVVTNVITEQQPQQKPENIRTAAEVAQSTFSSSRTCNVGDNCVQVLHGEHEGEGSLCVSLGSATSVSGRPRDDLYDGQGGGEGVPATRCGQSLSMGPDDIGGGKTQREDLCRGDQWRPGICQLDEETSKALQRLGDLVSELHQGLGSNASGSSKSKGCFEAESICAAQEDAQPRRMERGGGRAGIDRGGNGSSIECRESHQSFPSDTGEKAVQQGQQGEHGGRGGPGDGAELADADRSSSRSIGSHHQEHQLLSREANDTMMSQMTSASCDVGSTMSQSRSPVSQSGHEILCHLETLSRQIEADLKEIMMMTSEQMSTRVAPRAQDRKTHLDLLEIYCEEDSNLTSVFTSLGMKAKRFTRKDGDLSTQAGQEKLWRMIEEEQPLHIWVAPECKFWGNFSRWNSGRRPTKGAPW